MSRSVVAEDTMLMMSSTFEERNSLPINLTVNNSASLLLQEKKSHHLCRRSPRDHFLDRTVQRNAMHFNRFLLFIALLFILASASMLAQRLTVSRIDTSRYPEIHAFVYALDAEGKPIGGLSERDFVV